MDIAHKVHEHGSDIQHKMKRLYKREKSGQKWSYEPCGWMCPDCGQMQKD